MPNLLWRSLSSCVASTRWLLTPRVLVLSVVGAPSVFRRLASGRPPTAAQRWTRAVRENEELGCGSGGGTGGTAGKRRQASSAGVREKLRGKPGPPAGGGKELGDVVEDDMAFEDDVGVPSPDRIHTGPSPAVPGRAPPNILCPGHSYEGCRVSDVQVVARTGTPPAKPGETHRTACARDSPERDGTCQSSSGESARAVALPSPPWRGYTGQVVRRRRWDHNVASSSRFLARPLVGAPSTTRSSRDAAVVAPWVRVSKGKPKLPDTSRPQHVAAGPLVAALDPRPSVVHAASYTGCVACC